MPKKGKVCAVAQCPNSSSVNKEFIYHRFPHDKKIRQMWIIKTWRKDKFNANTSRICSRHFLPEDYKRDLKAELLGYQPKALLKPEAIPSMYIKPESSNKNVQFLKKKRKKEQKSHGEEAVQDDMANCMQHQLRGFTTNKKVLMEDSSFIKEKRKELFQKSVNETNRKEVFEASHSNTQSTGKGYYYQVKKEARNKTKKITKKSTERVRNFRARQRALREYGLNIHDSHSSTSNDSFFEDTEVKTASLLSPIARNRRKVIKLKAILKHSDRHYRQIEDEFETLGMIWASKLNIMEETQRVLAEDLIYEVFKKGLLQDLTKNLQLQKVT